MSTKQKRTPGLVKRGETWHIDKWVRGRLLCESAGTSDRAEAERYLARKLEEMRQAEVYGVRPRRTFRQAATKHLNESRKATIADDAKWLKQLDPFIGDWPSMPSIWAPSPDSSKHDVLKGQRQGRLTMR